MGVGNNDSKHQEEQPVASSSPTVGMEPVPQLASSEKPKSWGRRVLGWCVRGLRVLLMLILFYFGFVLIGMYPVNNDYRPADDGVDIWVISNAVHADLVLPIRNQTMDWERYFPFTHFSNPSIKDKYVRIGWGDRGFFIDTPTWADMELTTAAKALLIPSETCMHVRRSSFTEWDDYATRIRISHEQYAKLKVFILSSFADSDIVLQPQILGNEVQCRLPGCSYGAKDAFYRANGSYHCFNTCNSWVGRALQAAEVRVGWSTPLPKTVEFYLPEIEKSVD